MYICLNICSLKTIEIKSVEVTSGVNLFQVACIALRRSYRGVQILDFIFYSQ